MDPLFYITNADLVAACTSGEIAAERHGDGWTCRSRQVVEFLRARSARLAAAADVLAANVERDGDRQIVLPAV
jgi:hypothetical protein